MRQTKIGTAGSQPVPGALLAPISLLVLLLGSCDPRSTEPPTPGSDPTFCGGIAGFPCADGRACVDDPRDDCDPRSGGADCGGVCAASSECAARYREPGRRYVALSPASCALVKFACEPGTEYFADSCGCGCQKKAATGAGVGEVCRSSEGEPVASCAAGLNCCYPCGIQGCAWKCSEPCDPKSPACAGGCWLFP